MRTLFDQARDADYEAIAKEARALTKSLRPNPKPEVVNDVRAQVARLRKRLAEVVAIDFFGAIGRQTAEGLLGELEARLNKDAPRRRRQRPSSGEGPLAALRGKTWVTRQGVHVDRIASAWLIRRFIDPEARLQFVSGKGYRPAEGELRFDMFKASSRMRAIDARSKCCWTVRR